MKKCFSFFGINQQKRKDFTLNTTEFKHYMQRGLGRCYLELQNCDDTEKYRKTVLWGCLHLISFDTQCEGTRAAYLYRLISFFPDREYFAWEIAEKYRCISGRDKWFFQQLTELLSFFSDDGSQTAKDALAEKYQILYSALLIKKSFKGYDFRRDNFEFLSIVFLNQCRESIPEKLIADFGNLFMKNRHYNFDWHFSWFTDCLEESVGKNRLLRELKKRRNIPEWKSFYDSYMKWEEEKLRSNASVKENISTAEELSHVLKTKGKITRFQAIAFSRDADEAEKKKLAGLIEAEENPGEKAEMLKAMWVWRENYPGDHQKLIGYAESDCKELADNAEKVLVNCQSETVYRYAKEKLLRHECDKKAIEILLSNYRAEDKDLILPALSELSIDYDEKSGWHGIAGHILDVGDLGICLPREFFEWIYEKSLCSWCRESAVRYMGKRRWLSQDIIYECHYDSNDDIVMYAAGKRKQDELQ